MMKSLRAALLALAVLVLAFVGVRGANYVFASPFYSDWSGGQRRKALVVQALNEYAVAHDRDSLTRLVGAGREIQPGVRLLMDDALHPRVRARIADAVAAAWSPVAPGRGAVPVIIALLPTDTQRVGGVEVYRFDRHAVSQAIPTERGQPCVATIAVRQARDSISVSMASNYVYYSMGACAFLYAFGMPGPHIRAWLDSTRYQAATEAKWWMPRRRFEQTYKQRAERWGAGDYPIRWEFSERIEIIACIAGDEDACQRLVLTRRDPRAFQRMGIWQLDKSPTLISPERFVRNADYSGGMELLSSIAQDYGVAKFAAFWTSTRPVPEAFEEAFGERFGADIESG